VKLGRSDLDVSGLCLGTNVFGWTCDEGEAFAVLDAYRESGGNFLDTADIYPWFDDRPGGELSELIIGRWCQSRRSREEMVIATKVGVEGGLGAANIRRGVEASLRRLGTDRIDLYYAHEDDPSTPLEETVEAFDALVREGKVRCLGACDYAPARMEMALEIAARGNFERYEVLQLEYNLVARRYEDELADLVARHELSTLSYCSLAQGFLTGKYRPGEAPASGSESPRAEQARAYLEQGGIAVLEALDAVATAHSSSPATVSLAWLLARPNVASVLASARTPAQLADLVAAPGLELSDAEVALLGAAGTVGV